ncbi:hypothetical protein HKD37_02G004498 [Glycine soja]
MRSLLAIYILGTFNMPRGSVNQRHVTCKDVKWVQDLIEHSLKQNMNKDEAIELISQVEIEPNFTKLVWQELEEANQEFFKGYYANMAWKHKMFLLNIFLEEQRQVMGLTSSVPLSTFDGSHNPTLSSQANSNMGLTTIPSSFPTFDGSLTAFASPVTFDELHNPVDLSQPSFDFDGSHNFAVFLQPNSNVDLTEIASFPTFDGLLNSAVLSQPNSVMAHLPPCKCITSTNIINDPSSMLYNQNADMSLIQGINGEMIELWLEYSGFDPLNGLRKVLFCFRFKQLRKV